MLGLAVQTPELLDVELVAALVLAVSVIAIAWVIAMRARGAAGVHAAEQKKYKAVLAQLPDTAILVFDHDLRFVLLEGDALEGHGWTREEIVGRTLAELVPDMRLEPMVAAYRAALAGETQALEWPAVRGNAFYRTEVAPLRDEAGTVVRGIAVVRDITAQHDLRVDVERHRGFLAASLEQLAEPVIIADADGRVTLINAAARRVHGTTAGDVGGDPGRWIEQFGLQGQAGDPASVAMLPLFRALHGETVEEEVVSVTAADGTARRMLVTAVPVTAHDGQQLGAVLAANDVTERHAAEEALRASEERYRSAVQGVRDIVFQVDLGGRWTFLNEAWERHTGHTVASTLGHPCWELIHADDRAAQAGDFERLTSGDEDFVSGKHRYVTAAGRVRWVEVRAQLLRGHSGRPTGVTGVMEDVTDEIRDGQYQAAERAVLASLAATTDTDEGVRAVLETLARQLEWDVAELWVRGGDHLRRDLVWQGALSAEPEDVGVMRLEIGDGLPGRAWALRRPVWVSDLTAGPPCPRVTAAAAAGLRSAVAFPIAHGRDVHAVVVLFGRAARTQEPRVDRPLEAIGAHIAHFLERCRAERRIAESAADLAVLSRVAHELASEMDLGSARVAVCEAAVDVSGASRALLLEPDGPDLLCVASAGAVPEEAQLPARGRSAGAIRAFAGGLPVFAGDLRESPELVSPWIAATDTRAAYWQPLVHEGTVVGVLVIGWTEPRAELSERLRELLRVLAADASLAVVRTRLLDQVAARHRRPVAR
jgi:PAS domain S-box-containing protein